jgi:hypothetical protein
MQEVVLNQQYYLNKLGITVYQRKSMAAPAIQLCLLGREHWSAALKELGDSIVSALKKLGTECSIKILEDQHELAEYAPSLVLISEQEGSQLQTQLDQSHQQVFIMEQLLQSSALKKQFWQSCCDA